MTKLFIGMPAYNEERYIREAIESVQAQDYKDWIMVISDNASTDKTGEICEEYARRDKRIHYTKQPYNTGARNWQFLVDCVKYQTDIDYLVLIGANDVWENQFLSACIGMLDEHVHTGLAFSNMINIDSYCRIIREYPKFRFSGASNEDTVLKYLYTPEFMGKANCVFGVWRINLFKEVWQMFPFMEWEWGYDYCMVLAAIARSGICIDDRVLFRKRIIRDTDKPDKPDMIDTDDPRNYRWGLMNTWGYIKNNLRAVKGTPYYAMTAGIMLRRLL